MFKRIAAISLSLLTLAAWWFSMLSQFTWNAYPDSPILSGAVLVLMILARDFALPKLSVSYVGYRAATAPIRSRRRR